MKLIPIPPDHLSKTAKFWLPFVKSIAKRQRCSLKQRLDDITSGQVKLMLIYDEQNKVVKALIGLSMMWRGDDKVVRIVWAVGKDRHEWIGLLPELERMCRDNGAVGMEAISRRGWYPELKRHGYRLTHLLVEKDF